MADLEGPTTVKCGACRKTLPGVQAAATLPAHRTQDLISVAESSEGLPVWIQEKIDSSGWTKGKLRCPHCQARVGAFDFVGGAELPVHLVKSKVDVNQKVVLDELLRMREVAEVTTSNDPGWETTSSSASSFSEELTPASTTSASVSPSPDSSPRPSGLAVRSTRPMTRKERNKLRILRKRRATEKRDAIKKEANDKLMEILNAEPELEEIEDHLICPVCLDLLHRPFNTFPCKHVFCEPCLRRIGSKNAMNTLCPLCRTRIAFCDANKDLANEIREKHVAGFNKRKAFEKSTNVYTMPLPWRPGWRNLFAGRAMGGNRFQDRTMRDRLHRCMVQLPYYVPPVVLANLINLLLFIFLIGAFEIAPLFLGVLHGRGGPLANPETLNEGLQPSTLSTEKLANIKDQLKEIETGGLDDETQEDLDKRLLEDETSSGLEYAKMVMEDSMKDDDTLAELRRSEEVKKRLSELERFRPSRREHSEDGPKSLLPDTSMPMKSGVNLLEQFAKVILQEEENDELPESGDGALDDDVLLPQSYLPANPQASGPVQDATFYYIVGMMCILGAAFGNFLLIQHNFPLFRYLPFGARLDNNLERMGIGRVLDFMDFAFMIFMSLIPFFFFLPLAIPSQDPEEVYNWRRIVFKLVPEVATLIGSRILARINLVTASAALLGYVFVYVPYRRGFQPQVE